MRKPLWPVLLVAALLVLFFGGRWYVEAFNRNHPAPWPMAQGDAMGRFATPAVFADKPEVLWAHAISGAVPYPPAIGEDGTVYVSTGEQLLAIGSDGSRKWAWKGGTALSWVTLGRHGEVYVADREALVALDSQGRLAWRFPVTGERGFSIPPIVGQAGVLYLATGRELQAVTSDGKLKWSRDWRGPQNWPVEDRDGRILVAEGDRLTALDPDGSVAWEARLERTDRAGSVVADTDGSIYYRGARNLYRLDPEGHVTWQMPMPPSQQVGNLALGDGFVQDGLTRWSGDTRLWPQDPRASGASLFTYLDARGNMLALEVNDREKGWQLILRDPGGAVRWKAEEVRAHSLFAMGADGRICFAGTRASEAQPALICIGKR